MIEWAAKHFKTYLIMVITFITLVVIPSARWAVGFLVNLEKSDAHDAVQDIAIEDLKKLGYKMDGRFELIQLELRTVNERAYKAAQYKELKEARQEWQAKYKK